MGGRQQSGPIYGVIYLVTNLVNGKKYVGKTSESVEKRKRLHMISKYAIGNALRKYGPENFSWRVIDTALNLERLNALEIEWIARYDCRAPKGYNLVAGGVGGCDPSPRTLRKLSIAGKRRSACGQLKAARAVVNEAKRLREQAKYFESHRDEVAARLEVHKKRHPKRFQEGCRKGGLANVANGHIDRILKMARQPENAAKCRASIKAHQEANPEFWRQLGVKGGQRNIESGHIFKLNHLVHHERRGRTSPACKFCK
jgi:group I intron endonuclease